MSGSVKIHGAPSKEPQKPVAKAVFKDQGSIPYPNPKTIKTPKADKATITKGTARGMGAALRGGKFRIA